MYIHVYTLKYFQNINCMYVYLYNFFLDAIIAINHLTALT